MPIGVSELALTDTQTHVRTHTHTQPNTHTYTRMSDSCQSGIADLATIILTLQKDETSAFELSRSLYLILSLCISLPLYHTLSLSLSLSEHAFFYTNAMSRRQ